MVIDVNSLEIFKRNIYNACDIGNISDNCYLSIVVTNKCQNCCFYCINSETDRNKDIPINKCVKNINKVVNKYNLKEAILLGGEPLLHNNIFELIKKLRIKTNLKFLRLTTNGMFLRNNERFIKKLVNKDVGIQGINISYHNEDFIKLDELKRIYKSIKKYNSDIKVRVNINIWKNNNDKLFSLLKIICDVSFVDEIRVSNLIKKDYFSVNPINKNTNLILSDKEYVNIFNELINYFKRDYTIIENKKTLGFVKYLLIPTRCPIIINWNINSSVGQQICENKDREINTIKCLVSGDISLSWNQKNIILV